MSDVKCHFWNGSNTGRNCQEKADRFVRAEHSKRLCPLCKSCFTTFKDAQANLSEESKKAMPAGGAYTEVTFVDGETEYLAQPPKEAKPPVV